MDPDILAIQRKRRQQGRCIRCGIKTPRAMLCLECRKEWRYCPRCENVYPVGKTTPDDISYICVDCKRVHERRRNGSVPIEEYHAMRRAKADKRLHPVIRRYRRGESYKEIAGSLGISIGRLSAMIRTARRYGRWPEELRRQKKRRDAA